jgi:hypothetical protein
MTDQEDPMRTTIKPVHQWTPADGENPQKPRIAKWLFGILLLWPIFVWICGMLGAAVQKPFTDYLVFFGSPVVAAILAGIAIRHYPATGKFLKTLVGLLLIVTILWGGFFQCATLSHQDKLRSTIKRIYFVNVDVKPPLSAIQITFTTYNSLVSKPLFPVSDADANATLRGALAGVFGYASLFLSPYVPMLGPYYLLLMLIVSPFLALPIFWLWLVLSVLYVILPSKAWRWTGGALQSSWSAIRRWILT